MAKRTVSLTLKLTAAEAAQLAARAAEAGVPLRPYIRREALRGDGPPNHLEILLGKLDRLDELTRQAWTAVAADDLHPERVRQILSDVDATAKQTKSE